MPAKKLPYMAFFTSDYVRDTRILSLEARAIWMDILCLMHDGDRRGFLSRAGTPLGTDQIARFCGCPSDVAERALEEILAAGVASKDEAGVIFSRRILRDERRRSVAKRNGRKGGNPSLMAEDNGLVNQPDNSRLEYGDGIVSSPPGGGCGGRGGGQPGGFAAFWAAYPRKVKRTDAAAAWLKINPGRELQTRILAAVEAQRRSQEWLRDQGKYIPHPTTWLNQRRWEDELPARADPAGDVEDAAMAAYQRRVPETAEEFREIFPEWTDEQVRDAVERGRQP